MDGSEASPLGQGNEAAKGLSATAIWLEPETRNQVLRACLECVGSPVFSLDSHYRYTSFNRIHAAVMKAIYGVEIELGKRLLDYQAVEEDRVKAKVNLDRALAGETVVEAAYSGGDPASQRYFEVTHQPLRNDQGECLGVVVIAQDITLHRRALEAQAESERRFQTLFEQAGVGIGEVDSATGRYLQINQCYCDIVGYSKEELLQSTYQPLTHPEDLAASLALMAELRAGRIQKATLEKRYIRKDGEIIWVSIQMAKMTHGHPLVPSHISVVQDITARKQAERAIRDQMEELRHWQEATLGREARIISLKREVNELQVRHGLAPRYSSVFVDEGGEPPAGQAP